jgi:hypothetical protein
LQFRAGQFDASFPSLICEHGLPSARECLEEFLHSERHVQQDIFGITGSVHLHVISLAP